MTYTLTRADVNGGSALDLAIVQREENSKESMLFVNTMPASDSSSTIVLDILGAGRIMTIHAIKVDTAANIATFIGLMEDYINGNQTTRTAYHSDIRNETLYGYISNFRYVYYDGQPGMLAYSFQFTEGAAI